MATKLVNGLEKLEVAVLLSDGTVDASSWTQIENVEEGSVTLTSTAETKTTITPEDKDTPILTLYNPGDPDTYNFALLEVSPEIAARFFNIEYDAATTLITFLAKKKHAVLAIRMTSREQDGVKAILTFRKTVCDPSWKNNITKTGLLAIAVAASIQSWKTISNKDATMTVQFVDENGDPIDSTPEPTTFDTEQTFASATSATSEGITTTVTATDAQTKFEFNAISSPVGTPVTMTLKKAGVSQAAVDYPSDYTGHSFKFTDSDGVVHTGTFASGNVTLS